MGKGTTQSRAVSVHPGVQETRSKGKLNLIFERTANLSPVRRAIEQLWCGCGLPTSACEEIGLVGDERGECDAAAYAGRGPPVAGDGGKKLRG